MTDRRQLLKDTFLQPIKTGEDKDKDTIQYEDYDFGAESLKDRYNKLIKILKIPAAGEASPSQPGLQGGEIHHYPISLSTNVSYTPVVQKEHVEEVQEVLAEEVQEDPAEEVQENAGVDESVYVYPLLGDNYETAIKEDPMLDEFLNHIKLPEAILNLFNELKEIAKTIDVSENAIKYYLYYHEKNDKIDDMMYLWYLMDHELEGLDPIKFDEGEGA